MDSAKPQNSLELLYDAIARSTAVILSLPSAGLLHTHKSRFLGGAPEGFWVESVPGEGLLLDDLIARQQPCRLSFKSGHKNVSFSSLAKCRDPNFQLNADTTVEALRLTVPDEIESIQRRSAYRVTPTPDIALSLCLWRIAEKAQLRDRPMTAQEIGAQLLDVSVGGLGAMLRGKVDQPVKVALADRLRIELSYGGDAILLEGRLRHLVSPSGPHVMRAGIQFHDLERDLAGRRTLAQLTTIVGVLQREEARRRVEL